MRAMVSRHSTVVTQSLVGAEASDQKEQQEGKAIKTQDTKQQNPKPKTASHPPEPNRSSGQR